MDAGTVVVGGRTRAYAYTHGADWELWHRLRPTGDGMGQFGRTVDVSGQTMVVGQEQDGAFGTSSGAAHVFEPLRR